MLISVVAREAVVVTETGDDAARPSRNRLSKLLRYLKTTHAASVQSTLRIGVLREAAKEAVHTESIPTVAELATELLVLARHKHDIYGVLDAMTCLGQLALWLDQPTLAALYFRRALDLARQHALLPESLCLMMGLSTALAMLGLRDDVHRLHEIIVGQYHVAKQHRLLPLLFNNAAHNVGLLDENASARRYVAHAQGVLDERSTTAERLTIVLTDTALAFGAGEVEYASQQLARLAENRHADSRFSLLAHCNALRADIALHQKDIALATQFADECLKFAQASGLIQLEIGATMRAFKIATIDGRMDSAVALLPALEQTMSRQLITQRRVGTELHAIIRTIDREYDEAQEYKRQTLNADLDQLHAALAMTKHEAHRAVLRANQKKHLMSELEYARQHPQRQPVLLRVEGIGADTPVKLDWSHFVDILQSMDKTPIRQWTANPRLLYALYWRVNSKEAQKLAADALSASLAFLKGELPQSTVQITLGTLPFPDGGAAQMLVNIDARAAQQRQLGRTTVLDVTPLRGAGVGA